MSKGSACVKGYHSVQALYGRDRITRAMVRRDGALVEVPLPRRSTSSRKKLRETAQQHGKDSVALYGSAQWTIPDAYVASKLFKGALGTNNVETSTRLYAASAMAGLESSFGLDGAIGCYEDIDHADVFVLWDANLAETDPVLFSRMLDRRRADPAVRIIHLSTRTTRTSYAADHACCTCRMRAGDRQRHLPRDRGPRSWCITNSSTGTSPSSGARPTSATALRRHCRGGRRHRRHLGRLRGVPGRDYTPERAQELSGVAGGEHPLAGVALWRPVRAR